MDAPENSTVGDCPECGHTNERTWVMCDACGARLPWAPPEKAKLQMSEMTDEQLFARFVPPPQKREPLFLMSHRGRPVLAVLVALCILLWWILT